MLEYLYLAIYIVSYNNDLYIPYIFVSHFIIKNSSQVSNLIIITVKPMNTKYWLKQNIVVIKMIIMIQRNAI